VLVRLAANKLSTVMNGNDPGGGDLSEIDRADMDIFLSHIRLLASTLGIGTFDAPPKARLMASPTTTSLTHDGLKMAMSGEGYMATCIAADGQYFLQTGSKSKVKESPSVSPSTKNLRKELVDSGVLVLDGQHLVFQQDFAFSSPSAAAGVVVGSNISGNKAWKVEGGLKTYGEWLEDQIAAAPPLEHD
jgi:Domain of unknown function (DUF4357)